MKLLQFYINSNFENFPYSVKISLIILKFHFIINKKILLFFPVWLVLFSLRNGSAFLCSVWGTCWTIFFIANAFSDFVMSPRPELLMRFVYLLFTHVILQSTALWTQIDSWGYSELKSTFLCALKIFSKMILFYL